MSLICRDDVLDEVRSYEGRDELHKHVHERTAHQIQHL